MKSAAEIAKLAQEAGHSVAVMERPAPPEYPDAMAKYWAVCSCGWEARKKWKAKKVATMDAIRHAISSAADADLKEKRKNGF